jgi:hypothetical protein
MKMTVEQEDTNNLYLACKKRLTQVSLGCSPDDLRNILECLNTVATHVEEERSVPALAAKDALVNYRSRAAKAATA